MSKCGGGPVSSCLCVIRHDLLYLGSKLGDSILIKLTKINKKTDKIKTTVSTTNKLDFDHFELFNENEEISNEINQNYNYTLKVVDVVQCNSPIRDMVAGAPSISDENTKHTSLSPQIVACVGQGRSGALAVMRNGIVAEILTEVKVDQIECAWALYYHHYNKSSNKEDVTSPDATFHSYLVLTNHEKTIILESGSELEEISNKLLTISIFIINCQIAQYY